MVQAVSYAARATDERVTCLRIYADTDGETHMQEIDVSLFPKQVFKDNSPLRLSDTLVASGCVGSAASRRSVRSARVRATVARRFNAIAKT
jgi:hypothetical protein